MQKNDFLPKCANVDRLNLKQKILLNFLMFLGNKKYSRLKVFKIAFLLSREITFYDFIPYKYGPYSFEMDKNLRVFNKNGWINMEGNTIRVNQDILKQLSFETAHNKKIQEVTNNFLNLNKNTLIDFIYKTYPFYTLNSLIKKQQKIKKPGTQISIYTIGYQNFSIDLFLNVLIKKGIKTVLDVRNKPFSYKYGFSYPWLNKYLPEFGIEYINISELGIEEKYRKRLSEEQLWVQYSTLLENKKDYVNKASLIVMKKPTVLMCYEMNPGDCHRSRLAKRIQDLINLPIINFDIENQQWIKLNY